MVMIMMTLTVSAGNDSGKLPFPSVSDLNARLRRIVAAFQKNHKKELMKQEQNEKVSSYGLVSHWYLSHETTVGQIHKCLHLRLSGLHNKISMIWMFHQVALCSEICKTNYQINGCTSSSCISIINKFLLMGKSRGLSELILILSEAMCFIDR